MVMQQLFTSETKVFRASLRLSNFAPMLKPSRCACRGYCVAAERGTVPFGPANADEKQQKTVSATMNLFTVALLLWSSTALRQCATSFRSEHKRAARNGARQEQISPNRRPQDRAKSSLGDQLCLRSYRSRKPTHSWVRRSTSIHPCRSPG